MSKKKRKSGHCIKCGTFREALHRDHIVPKWNKGSDDESNVQYLCANCHEEKTQSEQRTLEYLFMQGEHSRRRWADVDMRAKIEASMQGVPKTEETRKAMSESAKAYRATPEGKKALARAREAALDGWTPEARQAQSDRLQERFKEPELRARCGVKNIGVVWPEERREAYALNRTGRTQPRKKGFTPLSDEHKATIVEGKRKRREFLASLTPRERELFKIAGAERKLEKLQLQMKRQAELSSDESETVN